MSRGPLGPVLAALLAALVPPAVCTEAGAVPKEQCIDAHENGQRLWRAARLLEAKEAFLLCSSEECPALFHAECADYLAKVLDEQPSIVVEVRDDRGRDLPGASVTLDDAPDTLSVDGKPVVLDPGSHTVRVRRADGAVREEVVVLAAGEKNRKVAFVFATAPSPSAAPRAPMQGPPARAEGGRSLGAPFWVAAGTSVLGLAAFGTFAALGKVTESCKGACKEDEVHRLRFEYAAADISLGVAVVAAGVATVLFLTSPRRHPAER